MTFQEWRKEGEQMLMAWHHDDPACVDNDHWRQCFEVAPLPKRRVMTCWPRGIAVAAILGFGAISLMDVAAHAEPGVFCSDNRRPSKGPRRRWVSACGKVFSRPSTKPMPPAELMVAGLSWSPTTTGTSRKRRLPTPSA